MFVLKGEDIMVNEIAPRPHNSGHWTKDACNISQFDALVRSIFDMPIPQITYIKSCKMINLLGDNFYFYKKYLKKKTAGFTFMEKLRLGMLEKWVILM